MPRIEDDRSDRTALPLGERLRGRRRRVPGGLIFAVAGRQLGVLGEAMFSVIVIMVILTTLVTPPVLTFLLRRKAA